MSANGAGNAIYVHMAAFGTSHILIDNELVSTLNGDIDDLLAGTALEYLNTTIPDGLHNITIAPIGTTIIEFDHFLYTFVAP
jgi:hypothetical protein